MFIFRNARKQDIESILKIEKDSFPSPWSYEAFLSEISKANYGKNIFLVAEDKENNICGYICANIVIDYIHILNLAVDKKYRRQGIASNFLKKVIDEGINQNLYGITLEVRESNEPAINLYRKFGFVIKGRREKYYDNKEDALIMWKYL